jgi:imidazolonepropionase-like amidohydrolase
MSIFMTQIHQRMKTRISLLLILVTVTLRIQAQGIVNSAEREIVIKSVNLISMENDQVEPNQTIVIRNGKITAIGKNLKYGKDALIIDGKGKYLIPGLAEMHAHVPPIDDIEPMKDVLKLFAFNGITTIRGMLGHPRHIELRTKIQSGEILGPRFYISGPSANGNSVKSVEDAIKLVKDEKAMGYDFIKLHPGLTKETFTALSKAAQEVGMPYAGHVSFKVGVWMAAEAKYATIDHLDGMVEALVPDIENITEQQNGSFGMFSSEKADESRIPIVLKALKDNGVWIVPTQALAERWFAPAATPELMNSAPEMKYMDSKTRENWMNSKKTLVANPQYNAEKINKFIALRRKLILESHKSGIGILLGSDGPQIFNVPGFSVHHELRYMVDSGLTPYQALQTGTVNVAKFYNSLNRGKIKPGYVADLVLLNGNPLQDINNTTAIEGVMLNGKWLSKKYIDEELQKLVKN